MVPIVAQKRSEPIRQLNGLTPKEPIRLKVSSFGGEPSSFGKRSELIRQRSELIRLSSELIRHRFGAHSADSELIRRVSSFGEIEKLIRRIAVV